ncbi:hypothetical protein [Reyranella sp.]|jgi:hypothetical protein|uniref:hypothetical protein n=1 Tax=Reyranella sp. TaxID=1929291 RepID=UPI002F95C9B6
MRGIAAAVSFFALVMGWDAARADCPMDLGHGTGWVVFSEHYMIAFRPDPMLIEVGEPVSLIMNVCTKSGEAAELVRVGAERVDAKTAGQHLKVSGGANGRYRVDGLSFLAPGRWEIEFDVRSAEGSEELTHEIVVK